MPKFWTPDYQLGTVVLLFDEGVKNRRDTWLQTRHSGFSYNQYGPLRQKKPPPMKTGLNLSSPQLSKKNRGQFVGWDLQQMTVLTGELTWWPQQCQMQNALARQSRLTGTMSSFTDFISVVSKQDNPPVHHDTNKIVFMWTLAIYCALKECGCDVSDPTVNLHVFTEPTAQDPHLYKQPESCLGQILLKYGKYSQPYLECEYHTPTTLAHLSIRDLNEYDIEYLQALLMSNSTVIAKHENVAKHGGIAHWHCDKAGLLHHGILKPSP
ncbi:hypothetical protein BDN71DRAFT_1427429 [Pleurotus eryngii]|uniref:Uncharacterized protein n=1 Tax=Pleurotus eryngii TaxID=5323 RepID=A0A9P6DK21_PLEER|nr:hypothetical protein BDN71DRAFT_1427429 [Pleurotus eryngii]